MRSESGGAMRKATVARARAVWMLVLLAWLVCAARPLAAQTCVGDCTGVGMVGISDLILAVNIALGLASADQCTALGLPPIGISQLVASVNNALCGCQPCPTPPPAPTATPTAIAATPTATSTPTEPSSSWHEDNVKVPSSTCSKQITNNIRQQITGTTSDYTVRQIGTEVSVDDGQGSVLIGTIDPDGDLEAGILDLEFEGVCEVTISLHLSVNLSSSPAAAKYKVAVTTMN